MNLSCRNCGREFTKLQDGKIPTHDFPPPCRSVCRGSGKLPRKDNHPLWKDDSIQEARDFLEDARFELQLFGFAVVKEYAVLSDTLSGVIPCPLCGGRVSYGVSESNGHCSVVCDTPNCIKAME